MDERRGLHLQPSVQKYNSLFLSIPITFIFVLCRTKVELRVRAKLADFIRKCVDSK